MPQDFAYSRNRGSKNEYSTPLVNKIQINLQAASAPGAVWQPKLAASPWTVVKVAPKSATMELCS